MATVVSGPVPWSHEDFWKWREGYKRVTKRSAASQGVEHTLSSGWREKPKSGWDQKPTAYNSKQIRLYNGKTVTVPDADYEDFIGHRKSEGIPGSDIDMYISNALSNEAEQKGKVQKCKGVGHILYMRYAPTYQVLEVEFETDNAVVVFFRVPKEVYSELRHLAESGTKLIGADGKPRHALGMRFWDIIRIRGQREGSRYRYEYTMPGEYEPKGTAAQMGAAFEKGVEEGKLGSADSKLAKDDLKMYIGLLSTSDQAKFLNMYKTTDAGKLYKFLYSNARKGPDGQSSMPSLEELTEEDF